MHTSSGTRLEQLGEVCRSARKRKRIEVHALAIKQLHTCFAQGKQMIAGRRAQQRQQWFQVQTRGKHRSLAHGRGQPVDDELCGAGQDREQSVVVRRVRQLIDQTPGCTQHRIGRF